MIEITARDVVGTARASANVAILSLDRLMLGTAGPRKALEIARNNLVNALSDVALAEHMLDHGTRDTVYVGGWPDGPKEEGPRQSGR